MEDHPNNLLRPVLNVPAIRKPKFEIGLGSALALIGNNHKSDFYTL